MYVSCRIGGGEIIMGSAMLSQKPSMKVHLKRVGRGTAAIGKERRDYVIPEHARLWNFGKKRRDHSAPTVQGTMNRGFDWSGDCVFIEGGEIVALSMCIVLYTWPLPFCHCLQLNSEETETQRSYNCPRSHMQETIKVDLNSGRLISESTSLKPLCFVMIFRVRMK